MATEKPDYCGHCGYDLTGLRAVSDCPECGQPYSTWVDSNDQTRKVAVHTQERWIYRHARSLKLASVAMAFMCCGGMLSLLTGPTNQVVLVAALLACMIFLSTLISFLFERLE
jgi:hypothetical protein